MHKEIPYPLQGRLLRNWGAEALELHCDRRLHFIVLEGLSTPDVLRWRKELKSSYRRLFRGKQMTVDVRSQDEYHREVGRVYVDGKDLNLFLIENGFAEFSKAPIPGAGEFKAAEMRAQKKKLGIWAWEQ